MSDPMQSMQRSDIPISDAVDISQLLSGRSSPVSVSKAKVPKFDSPPERLAASIQLSQVSASSIPHIIDMNALVPATPPNSPVKKAGSALRQQRLTAPDTVIPKYRFSVNNQFIKPDPTQPALWFEAFLRNTNQKSMTVDLLSSFLGQVYGKEIKPLNFLDVGCSNGLQGFNILSRLTKNTFNYQGIDSEARDLDEARRLFQINQIPSSFVSGDCFNEEIQEELGSADIVLVSHVAYYTKDLHRFISSYCAKLKENGLAIFVHNVRDSDTGSLREKYGADLTLDVTASIEILVNKLEMKAVTYQSHLRFPENMEEYWESLRKISLGEKFSPNCKETTEAKYLLEFVVQQPLETLQKRGLLDEYLAEVKDKLTKQDNCIYLRSRMQIVNSPAGLEKEFLSQRDKAFNLLEQEITAFAENPAREKQYGNT